MQVKTFVGHEPCPNCGSSDNVGVWSDGQKFCFTGCGFYVAGEGIGLNIELIKAQLKDEYKKERSGTDDPVLPVDYSLVIRSDAKDWLNSYQITNEECFSYRLGWSDLYESLILPSFDLYGNLCVVQRRYFGKDGFPKYHTKGRPDRVIWTCRPDCRSVVDGDTYNGDIIIVEDVLSAIKVGRVYEATPLWGSSLSVSKMSILAKMYTRAFMWLDPDKLYEASVRRQQMAAFFEQAHVVISTKDPKCYDQNGIKFHILNTLDETESSKIMG